MLEWIQSIQVYFDTLAANIQQMTDIINDLAGKVQTYMTYSIVFQLVSLVLILLLVSMVYDLKVKIKTMESKVSSWFEEEEIDE